MPTENRSSNTEMVSVPREPTEEMLVAGQEAWATRPRGALEDCEEAAHIWAAMVATTPDQQSEHHRGEPLGWVRPEALEAFKDVGWVHVFRAKGGDDSAVAVYTHADPGEVERLREGITKHWKVVCDQRAELDTLREQLRLMTGDYRTAIVNGHERITFLGGDCDSVEKMLADNPNYANAQTMLKRQS